MEKLTEQELISLIQRKKNASDTGCVLLENKEIAFDFKNILSQFEYIRLALKNCQFKCNVDYYSPNHITKFVLWILDNSKVESCHFKNVHLKIVGDVAKNATSAIKSTVFDSCTFYETSYRGEISKCTFNNSSLNKVRFVETKITNSWFNKCKFDNAVFGNADLTDTNFRDCNGKKTDFTNANMVGTTFESCKFLDSDLSEYQKLSLLYSTSSSFGTNNPHKED